MPEHCEKSPHQSVEIIRLTADGIIQETTTVINLKHHPELKEALEDREEFEGVVREEVIERYRQRLWQRIREGDVSLEELARLHGKTLACWCHPKPCHCNVLARAAAWAVSVLAGRKAA
jgi:hypothetical protein